MFFTVNLRQNRRWALPLAALLLLTCLWRGSPAVSTANPSQEGVPVPVVMYHSLLPGGNSDYVIDPALLEQDLIYLQQQGYTTVVMADLLAYVQEGTPLPDKPVMLTFDDGYYNNYLYAHPLLKQYGMKALLSPIGSVSEFYSDHPEEQNKPRYSHVTWTQLAEMVKSGVWEIGHHSYDLHRTDKGRRGVAQKKGEPDATYRQRLTEDLQKATTLLKKHVGVTPTTFTYPFGAHTAGTDPILKEAGFAATLSCVERVSRITRSPDSLWRIGRHRRPPGIDSHRFFTQLEE